MQGREKAKIYNWVEKNITTENIRTCFLLSISVIIFFVAYKHGEDLFSGGFIDFTVLFSFIVLFLSGIIAGFIRGWVERKFEDYAKINSNADRLVRRYPSEKFVEIEQYGLKMKLPGIPIWERTSPSDRITVEDQETKYYELPEVIKENYDRLMKLHRASDTYNQINIRLDDAQTDGGDIVLKTSRTYFYSSLLTNRSCDGSLKDRISIRDYFEPGPYFSPLSVSKLSNHLGINGLLMVRDKNGEIVIPFVKRSRNVSVGKGTVNCSISASLKVKYAVRPDHRKVDMSGITASILGEIRDELAFDISGLVDEATIEQSILYLYRDVSECGKPQLIMILDVPNVTKETVSAAFYRSSPEEIEDVEKRLQKDGRVLVWISLKDLMDAKLEMGGSPMLRVHGKKYSINMATSIALAFEINYLREHAGSFNNEEVKERNLKIHEVQDKHKEGTDRKLRR